MNMPLDPQGANIQLLDLPGIIEGAAGGKVSLPMYCPSVLIYGLQGRGKQVIAVARTADMVSHTDQELMP